jgi:L-alanine-DL-glutamate epimerase-like enolase superfamily enzyme
MPAPLPRNQRPQIMAAIGGIDIALWDIKGKAAGLPVFRILGGTRTEVFTYATGGYYLEGEPLGACRGRARGFRFSMGIVPLN